MRLIRRVSLAIGATLLLAGVSPVASAQEIEPNNSCFSAPDAGTIAPGSIVTGSIDAANASPFTDVDFFRVSAAPGTDLRFTVSVNQRVGVFSDQCVLQGQSDGFSDNKVDFTVPASGTFILAVSDRFDNFFQGFGFVNAGAYQITVALQPPKIGSISGRLVDAVSLTPLIGPMPPFARVELRRCINGSCFNTVNSQSTDAAGNFRFELDFSGRRIEVGDFQLSATADEFQPVTLLFSVGADQNLQVGDVKLIPPPILFSNIRPCTAILPQGGSCGYTVAIRNNTTAKFTGQALSLVNAGFNATVFEASTSKTGTGVQRATVSVPALSSRDVTFFFNVPSFVPNGTTICTRLQLGLDPSPLFNVMRQRDLFCIAKGGSGFTVMSAEQSKPVFDMMKGVNGLNAPTPQPLK